MALLWFNYCFHIATLNKSLFASSKKIEYLFHFFEKKSKINKIVLTTKIYYFIPIDKLVDKYSDADKYTLNNTNLT